MRNKSGGMILAILLTLVVLSSLMAGCGKSEAVKSVEALIGEIDEEVTLDSAEKIMQAQSAYDQLF